MATSGTYTFSRTRNQIIAAALRKINAVQAGETPSAAIYSDAAECLNSMIKRWQANGIHLWTQEEATLFLQTDQVQYALGSASTDHATQSYTATTLSAAASSGASSISVASATGISASYNIGVVLDSGTIDWTTVSGIASTTVTLAATLDGAAASGNAVYIYQTKIVRPLRIPSARRYNFSSAIDTPLTIMSRIDYRELPNKTTEGTVTSCFYDPRGGANELGQFYVWPEPDDVTNAIKFTWYRPIQDFSVAGDTPDFPQEWIDPLVFNLAVTLAPEYDVPTEKFAQIKMLADDYFDQVQGWDKEPESILFGADMEQ